MSKYWVSKEIFTRTALASKDTLLLSDVVFSDIQRPAELQTWILSVCQLAKITIAIFVQHQCITYIIFHGSLYAYNDVIYVLHIYIFI